MIKESKTITIPVHINGWPELVEVPENDYPTLVFLKLYHIAGGIIDTQIRYKPGQDGRFVIQKAKESLTGTPLVKFEGFAPYTIFTLASLNRTHLELGLSASALAVSSCAMNWLSSAFVQEGRMEAARLTLDYYHKLQRFIFKGRKSGLTQTERERIYAYND
jgi:hypothetical protein